ncbi:MAG: TlpA family protein disulfide reductase [Ruminococcaceae bacterium]|nr:TlpA family protein disulfide reductase [Oscillospiraceae bacterium]
MNKKVLFIVLSVVLIVLLAGSVFIYDKLYDDYTDNNSQMQKVDKDENVKDSAVQEPEQKQEQEQEKEQEREQTDNKVPDVEFYDADGNAVMLSSFFDKPLVLNFWATWCGPCKSEMPGFNSLYEEYKDRVNFVFLNVSDDENSVAEFLDENGYSFPPYFDKTQVASYTYGASSIPLTFVMYKGGEIYGYQRGVLSEVALEEALKNVLKEE